MATKEVSTIRIVLPGKQQQQPITDSMARKLCHSRLNETISPPPPHSNKNPGHRAAAGRHGRHQRMRGGSGDLPRRSVRQHGRILPVRVSRRLSAGSFRQGMRGFGRVRLGGRNLRQRDLQERRRQLRVRLRFRFRSRRRRKMRRHRRVLRTRGRCG